MKKSLFLSLVAALILCTAGLLTAQQICSNKTGSVGNGYQYEFWTMGVGSACMTVKGADAQFEAQWSNVEDFFALVGLQYNRTQTPTQIGTFSATFASTGNLGNIALMGIHGWMTDPYIEFYIIDNWGSWVPPGNIASKGFFTTDGSQYKIYWEKGGPSITISDPLSSPEIYWSVRVSKRKSGTISISEHFAQWEKAGMPLSKLYNVMLFVEGIQSTGNVVFTEANVTVSKQPLPTPTPTPIALSGDVNGDGIININDALLVAKHTSGSTIPGTFIASNADVNKDSLINIIDALKIAQYSAGLITTF